ncbi:MAG: hypothetical protein FWE22_03195 [Firmicutes bacterium]|nr:hypothetical protein [Bacillota bacterium]
MKNKILKILLSLVLVASFGLVAVGCGGHSYDPAQDGSFRFNGQIRLANWLTHDDGVAGELTQANAVNEDFIDDAFIARVNAERAAILTLFEGDAYAILTVAIDEEEQREGDGLATWTNREWDNFRFEIYNDIYRPINLAAGDNVIDNPSEEGFTAGAWHIKTFRFYGDYLFIVVVIAEDREINNETRRVVFAEFDLTFVLQQ